MLSIRWTVEALEDLGQLIDYIAEHNVWAAQTMFEVIENAIIPASITPFLFRTGREAGTREIVAHPNYIVVYRILEDGIEVVSVVHARQRYPSD
jgi:toxin ParE1/3/4